MENMIQQLADAKGIQTAFIDAWGKPTQVAAGSKEKMLQAMGYDVHDSANLERQIQAEIEVNWTECLEPVYVLREQAEMALDIRVPLSLANESLTLLLRQDSKIVSTINFTPADGHLVAALTVDDEEIQQYKIAITAPANIGYYEIELQLTETLLATSRLIYAPSACYIPEDIQAGKKLWGLSVQLYTVRSERNWGIGDFTDLCQLIQNAAANGADYIGLNPIHQLYPANPDACSPYGPSSRLWLNYLYLDVEQIEGFDTPAVQAWCQSQDLTHKLASLRALDYVDYEGVAALKLPALKLVFDAYREKFLTKNTRQNKAFKEFVKDGGESLTTLAVFEALQDHLHSQSKACWGWPVFPQEYREYNSPAVQKFAKKHKDLVTFYQFLQWQAQLQFEHASQTADEAGMEIGLYRDLAVGVSEGSAEIWGNKDLYAIDASVGAPPDILGPLGQNWGLPPMDPTRLHEQAYQPIIDLFASNMKASGALRIDHVMALLRLWWVYKGDDASEGCYVGYPVDDLLAILALESHLNQSLVIGEDLGTVPEEIRAKLADNGMFSYRLFFFEQAEDGGFYSPAHYPVQSMATLTTHDMPTLIGYWHCDDLVLGKEVGLYPDADVLANLYRIRHENKQHILNTLHGHASIPTSISRDVNYVGMSKELNYGMQVHMATGASALLSLQLEDWLEMDKPVNVPGTFHEYPNWKRKLSRNIEQIFSDQGIIDLAKAITEQRKLASTN